jgi:nicotinamidase-related amidase
MPVAALVLVDFFNPRGFEGGTLSRNTVRAARSAAKLKARLRARGVPAIYANDNFGEWESEFASLVATCKRAGGDVAEVAELLSPQPGDRSVLKPRHSAFYETPLEYLLATLGVEGLVLTGVSADSCIMFTAHDAYLRELALWVPSDCVASAAPAFTRSALAHMERILKASIAPSTGQLPSLLRDTSRGARRSRPAAGDRTRRATAR